MYCHDRLSGLTSRSVKTVSFASVRDTKLAVVGDNLSNIGLAEVIPWRIGKNKGQDHRTLRSFSIHNSTDKLAGRSK